MRNEVSSYVDTEQDEILRTFAKMMRPVVADGGRKRAAGEKVHWMQDPGHLESLNRHLARYERGELVDGDSGAHPLAHAAVRCLMLAAQDEAGPPLDWC
jgi:hypothetical protein